MRRISHRYTGHYVTEDGKIVICVELSVGGGPARFLAVEVPARSLDCEEVHDAMAKAAMALLPMSEAPPWEQDALPLW